MIGIIVTMHHSKLRRNGFDLINTFIKSLYKFCKRDFILYLFDNASVNKYRVPRHSNIRYEYIEDQTIEGLTLPFNKGIKKAYKDGCDLIIWVNDDVIFNETINDFIDILRAHPHKDIGLYGPLSNGVMGKSYQKASRAGKGIQEITNEGRGGYLNGFLWAFTREFYEKFKFSDGTLYHERLKWGGGEKIMIWRLRPLGLRIFIIRSCWLFHHKIRGWRSLRRGRYQ